ncbi:MAG: MMPL family transporter [Candidatus Saccharimonadales bacterium]
MPNILKAIGTHSYDHPLRMVSIWLVLIAALAFGAATNFKTPSSTVSIPGTEAYVGLERMTELFPDAGKGSARIVVVAPAGKILDSYHDQITTMTSNIAKVDGVKQAVSPYDNPSAMNDSHTTALIQVQLQNDARTVDQKTVTAVNNIINSNRVDGLSIEAGGDIVDQMPESILGSGEAVGLLIALGVLLITFFSMVAAGMPLLIAILAVGTSMAGLFSLSHVVDVNSTTPALAVMLGLAVGIDYSLFIISRYRSYLVAGMARRAAAIRASQTAGSAVVFAAATVVIALAALSVVRIPFMTIMGLTGAATVAMTAITAITLLPVLFRLVGPKIAGKKLRRKIEEAQVRGFTESHTINSSSVWHRWGSFVSRHPIMSIIIPIIIIGAIAFPVKSLTLGLPTDEFAATTTTERKAYDAIAKGFGPGYNAPLVVVVEHMQPVTDAEKAAAKTALTAQFEQKITAESELMQSQFQQRLKSANSPAEVATIQTEMRQTAEQASTKQAEALKTLDIKSTEYAKRLHLQAIGNKIAAQSNVAEVMPTLASDDGTTGILQVIPKTGTYDEATKDLINTLRDPASQQSWASKDVQFTVTGATALQIDINGKLSAAIPVYLLVVVGLSIVLLILAFRSILVPIKATLGYLLSVGAMFGALVAVFQWGWFGIAAAPAPIVSFIPIIGTGILFGLAMDYEFFLVSNMHEEYVRTGKAKQSVVNGFSLGSKVVTAAAIIMTSVFAGFISNSNNTVQALGFALAIGVLVDAFLVRMIIVPAVMTLIGKSAWWLPAWLNKILPRITIDKE